MLDIQDWSAVSQAVEWLPWDRRGPGTGVPKLPPLKNDATFEDFATEIQGGMEGDGRGSELGWKLAVFLPVGPRSLGPDASFSSRAMTN